ncbi:MAG: hypothetical protein M5U28_00415 [Sandaracinaceae bacterium]|nr:hypothetical protein [Sandaracinaceae bacterium]
MWLDTDGLRLTGGYLLAALPSRLVGERIEALGPGALAYAPEVARGRSGPAADRWAVAALVWESLTSRAPDVRTDPPELSPEARIALRRLLDPEPGRRAVDLSALLAALAAQASLAVPALDPEPHRPPTADIGAPPDRMGPPRARPVAGAADEGTQEISLDQIVEERAARAARRPIAGAAQDGTQEIALEEIVEEAGADDTAKHSAVSGEQDLDPRLVRAALGITLESERRASGPDSWIRASCAPRST